MSQRPSGSQTLERGLLALRLLGQRPSGMTASELGSALGIHRSIAHRLLATLVATGFATRDTSARHRLGPALVGLAERVRPSLRAAARPVLTDLAESLHATACLLVRDGDAAVAVAVVPPSRGMHLAYHVGNRDSLTRGAGGIALLACAAPHPDDDPRVITARADGLACSSGEVTPGTYAVAAPIPATHPDGPASLTLISHQPELLETARDAVRAAAAQLTASLT